MGKTLSEGPELGTRPGCCSLLWLHEDVSAGAVFGSSISDGRADMLSAWFATVAFSFGAAGVDGLE
jgi:hypothetical protein